MSNDLPNSGGSDSSQQSLPQTPISEPPNPPNSPNTPNPPNNTVDPVQSWVAQHEQRDAQGHFVKSDHLTNAQASQPTPNPQTNENNGLPLPIQVTQNNKYSEKNDPPMVAVQVTNPVTYFKKWVGKFLKNQDIDIHLKIKPFATIGLILAFTAVGGTSFSIGRYFFPNSSPIFHRAITLQGTIQRSESGQYYLSLPDNTLWTLRPKSNNINFNNALNREVLIKGNLTVEQNVVEVKEVIAFEKPIPIYNPPATTSAQPF